MRDLEVLSPGFAHTLKIAVGAGKSLNFGANFIINTERPSR